MGRKTMWLRMFVTRDEDADVGRALKEVFGDVEPTATSMILGVKSVDVVVFW